MILIHYFFQQTLDFRTRLSILVQIFIGANIRSELEEAILFENQESTGKNSRSLLFFRQIASLIDVLLGIF